MREKSKTKDETGKKPKLFALLHHSKEDEMALKQWKSAIKQMSIDGQWFKKQIGVILLAVTGIIIYITCRYQAQQEIILEEQLRKECQDWKFKCLTRSSELTLKSRQSQVEAALTSFGDSTLKISTEAAFSANTTIE
ncbi:MAG: hypothetical protein IIV13_03890 [Bacteroidaceae bacterium]|jgi:hypothetical protein|nr:hypothetical protein [Bacteroidaceae bacterium]